MPLRYMWLVFLEKYIELYMPAIRTSRACSPQHMLIHLVNHLGIDILVDNYQSLSKLLKYQVTRNFFRRMVPMEGLYNRVPGILI